jgi:hypothetical protein
MFIICFSFKNKGRYYIVQEGIKLRSQQPNEESKKALLQQMDLLEKQKKQLNAKVDEPGFGENYVKNFALRMFKVADDEDRTGTPTK